MAGRFFTKTVGVAKCNGKKNRGGFEVYGESIYTKRWELLGAYAHCRKMLFSFSYTDHDQNSVYGDMPYVAQRIGFLVN
jgi:outer membrane receptor for ferrienterochelin and colicins